MSAVLYIENELEDKRALNMTFSSSSHKPNMIKRVNLGQTS